jgi:hypothetical protein
MNLRLLLIACCLLQPLLAALPTDIAQPDHQLTPGKNDAPWQPLLAELRAKPPLRATFEEHRFFPFKKGFTRLEGEIRLDPVRGLSLHYTAPENQLMVVDREGGFMANARGRRRALPDNPRARAATSALLHVLRFDLPTLAADFTIYAARDGDAWKFTFIPRPGDLADVLNPITITGDHGLVRLIEMKKSDRQRVEIHIGRTETGVTFAADELARYFR